MTLAYGYEHLCRGSIAQDIQKLLKVKRNKFFCFFRVDIPRAYPDIPMQDVHQDLIPALARSQGIKLSIERLVDLHILTPWNGYPVIYILSGESRVWLVRDAAKFQEILEKCLTGSSIETFRLMEKRPTHKEWADKQAERLFKFGTEVMGLSVSLGPLFFTREEVENILALFVTPHGEIHRNSISWD